MSERSRWLGWRGTLIAVAGLASVAASIHLARGDDGGTCDPMTLEWSVIELSETEAFERPMIAAQGILEACGDSVPPVFRDQLSATADPLDSLEPGRVPTDPGAHEEEGERLWRSACPESILIDLGAQDAGALEHRRARYRRCGLGSLGLMDEAEFVHHDHVAAVSMFTWLRDQGVEPEIARVLVREAMIRGYRQVPVLPPEATTLPRSRTSGAVVDGPAVALSATAMSIGNQELASLEDGRFVQDELSAAMTGLLVHLGDQSVSRAVSDQPARSHMTLVPDQSVTVGALAEVIETGAMVGYTDYHIVGVRPEVRFPDLGMVGLHLRTSRQPGEADRIDEPASQAAESPVCAPDFVVYPGTVMHWVDGSFAGVATQEHRFEGLPRIMNGRACFEEGAFWLCVDRPPANLG
jgi:hypothetical protein